MQKFLSKRWYRLLVVLGLVILSVFFFNSQLQSSESSANQASLPDRFAEPRRGNGANLAVKSDLDPAVGQDVRFDKFSNVVTIGGADSKPELLAQEDGDTQKKADPVVAAGAVGARDRTDDTAPEKPTLPAPSGPRLPPGALFMVVLILSETPDAPHRRALRSSWAKQLADYQVDRSGLVAAANREGQAFTTETLYRHFFIVGRLAGILDYVRAEMEKERDVVMVDENDYASTSAKLYSALMWAKTNLEFEYILKAQDRVFVNVPGVIHWLGSQAKKRLYAGHMVHLARIMKKKRSPWYMADKFYPGKFYPDYLQSFAIIMSHDVVDLLMKTWRGTLESEAGLLHVDDLDLGIAMKNLSVSPVHSPNFYKGFNPTVCKNPQVLAVGEVPRDKLQVLGENSLRGKPSC